MTEAHFILSKKVVNEQVDKLVDLGLKVSYSYKTNREVGNVLQEICPEVDFSIHAKEEIEMIKNKSKIWFFTQAESEEELKEILNKGIRNFVIDNEIDLERILRVLDDVNEIVREDSEKKVSEKYFLKNPLKINLSLRMRFREHRIGTGRYFVYGMPCQRVNKLILKLRKNKFIYKLGVHIHRKSQNASEWEIKSELEDSLEKNVLDRIDFLNFGGGLPVGYISYTSRILNYIFKKIKDASDWLNEKGIEVFIEPGRFIAAPSVKLITEIIQIYDNKIVLNTTIYNCALDTVIGQHKMLVDGELGEEEDGEFFLLKGNSPTRDDIFRYKVKLKNPQVGDEIVFLNAGAYNYTTDFFGYKKLKTNIVEGF